MPDSKPRDANRAVAMVLTELVEGTEAAGESVLLNTGDIGLLRSLEHLSSAQASHSVDGGATLAAHAQHVRYGLSLLNEWASAGGDPFADARWDEAWEVSAVDERAWTEIRTGLRQEVVRWQQAIASRAELSTRDLHWLIGSVAHLAYHFGAMRQIDRTLRGPREGSFGTPAAP